MLCKRELRCEENWPCECSLPGHQSRIRCNRVADSISLHSCRQYATGFIDGSLSPIPKALDERELSV